MSGGSLDYACYKVDQIADDVEAQAKTPLQKAFAAHLRKVAAALKDLEWVWSGDCGDGDEEEAISKVVSPTAELEAAMADAEIAASNLAATMKRANQST